jgi:hypothetical protein
MKRVTTLILGKMNISQCKGDDGGVEHLEEDLGVDRIVGTSSLSAMW